jgi:hypothetical protein
MRENTNKGFRAIASSDPCSCLAFNYRSEFHRLLGAVEQAVAAGFASHAANSVLASAIKHYADTMPNDQVDAPSGATAERR